MWYYIQFWTNTLDKGMSFIIPLPVKEQLVPLPFFYKDDFGIK